MPKLVYLSSDDSAVINAARWLREHLDIPMYERIDGQFKNYFNCDLVRKPSQDFVTITTYVAFEESEAALFIHKW